MANNTDSYESFSNDGIINKKLVENRRHMTPLHYSVNIQWSNENQAFLVDVLELPGCHTHGDTYEEAIKNAVEVIALWIETAQALGWPIPAPKVAA